MLSWKSKFLIVLFFCVAFAQDDDDDDDDANTDNMPDFSTSKPPDVKCEGNESVADPENCHQFYQCYEGSPYPSPMTCGGLWFNPEVQGCDWWYKAPDDCKAKEPTKDNSATTAAPHDDDDNGDDDNEEFTTPAKISTMSTAGETDEDEE